MHLALSENGVLTKFNSVNLIKTGASRAVQKRCFADSFSRSFRISSRRRGPSSPQYRRQHRSSTSALSQRTAYTEQRSETGRVPSRNQRSCHNGTLNIPRTRFSPSSARWPCSPRELGQKSDFRGASAKAINKPRDRRFRGLIVVIISKTRSMSALAWLQQLIATAERNHHGNPCTLPGP
jgi:hypothetical protein